MPFPNRWRLSWLANGKTPTSPFEVTSKPRKSYPSETAVKRGDRIVHGDVEFNEKLGRNDLCPCGSGHRFQAMLHALEAL
jgi:uncharacterized protein YecA (UPF0149 family)